MIQVYAEVEGQVIDLNQSRVQLFLTCKRKYYWQQVLNLVVDRPQWPLSTGTAVHEGLATLNVGEGVDVAVEAALKKFDEATKEFKILPQEREKWEEQRSLVERLTRDYVGHYGTEEDWSILAPEVKGRVEVGDGTNVFLVFRTDAIISFMRAAYLLEHKTMAQNRVSNWLKYELDIQITAYCYGVAKVLGIPIQGVIVNGLIKTKTPVFNREMYVRAEKDLLEFELEFVEIAREIAWRKQRVAEGQDYRNVFYRNTGACFNYNQTCWYRQLCLDPKMTDLYIKRKPDYVDDPKLLETAKRDDDRGEGSE